MTAFVEITERQMREAEERMSKHVAENPVAISATFNSQDGRVAIELSNGASFAIPARIIQGLENASDNDLTTIEITASGMGLYFPAVDADILVAPLLAGVLGTRSFMAQRLGRAGGPAAAFPKRPRRGRTARAAGVPARPWWKARRVLKAPPARRNSRYLIQRTHAAPRFPCGSPAVPLKARGLRRQTCRGDV
jgi:hypothetical protein